MIIEHYVEEDSISLHRERLKYRVEDFCSRYNIKAIVGISGGADNMNEDCVADIISGFLVNLQTAKVAVLSGGTGYGVPKLATNIAHDLGLPTIGVYPEYGRKSALVEKLDLAIESLPPSYGQAGYGTETPTFAQLIHSLMVIGGGFGTLVEVGTILKSYKDRLKNNLPPIYLCPIKGTGGVADMIRTLPAIEKVMSCLPEEDIYTGIEAALFIRRKLFAS